MKTKLLSITVALAFAINAFAQIPTNGLVAYYPFTGNANDQSGNNNNGTVNGATLTNDRFGNPNCAYSFNGTSAFIQIANSSSFTISNNAISISLWMKISAWPTTSLEYYLFSKHSGTGNAQMGYHSYIYGSSNNSDPNNALVMRYRNGNTSTWGGVSKLNNTLPAPGTWFHVVYTVDNTSNKMYVNGVLVDTEVAQIIGANTSDFFIGKDPIGGQHYSGLLDDIAIYNRALTPTEVTQIYAGVCSTVDITTGLVAQYNFSGNANDLSGNNLNGTVTGAILTTDRFGNANSAYSFDGNTNQITLPSSELANATALSVSGWFNANPSQSGFSDIFQIDVNNPNIGNPANDMFLRYNNGLTNFTADLGIQGSISSINTTSPSTGTWHHFALTYNGSILQLYIDGVFINQGNVSGTFQSYSEPLYIGNWNGAEGFNGKIDDIRIYNRALTSCDIDSLYTTPNPCTSVTASITPNGTTTFCQGGNVILTATSAVSYLWSNGGATTQSITVSNAGNYSVTTTNSNGCSATSATTVVTVNPLPTVTLSPLTSICANVSAFNLTGGAPIGGTYTGTGVSGNAFSPSVSGVGTFSITYSYTDGNTCSSSASQNIIVNPLPTVTLSPLNPVCSNASAFNLTGGTPTGGTYTGTGVSGNAFSPSVSGLGTFPITYSFTDGNSCSSSATQNITVYSCAGTCFSTPDGLDGSNWSYKDYIIPTGYKLDSIYMNATRPGYTTQNYDLVVESCQGTTTYNHTIGTYPFSYTTDNNSEYNVWINLTSFNYISTGMVRVSLPTNAGAIWNNLCFATSLQNISWTPCSTATVNYSGQTYNTVQIGTQCWFHENLNLGAQVADVNSETNNSIVEKACYNNTSSNCNTYGGIYNWDEAMNYGIASQGICPTGWHIPTQAEFQTLISYLGSTTAGQKMKVTSSDTPPWDGTNTSGFTALSGGIGQGTSYLYQGTRETYWSSTAFSSSTAYDYDLSTSSNTLTEAPNTKDGGYCIRCIQDITTGIFSPYGAMNYFAIYPNPTIDNCEVDFSLNSNANVKLSVYNLLGEQVSSIFENTQLTSGIHKFSIKTSELVKGIYFVNLTVDGKSTIKKMVKLN